jgi:hypothetical protein
MTAPEETAPAPRKRGRPRKIAIPSEPPIPLSVVDEVTRAIALERSNGDRNRIKVIDAHTVLITNRPNGVH